VDDTVRGVAILGSTGSIGRQTIEVLEAHPNRFRLVGLVAGRDGAALAAQAAELGIDNTALGSEAAAEMAARDDVDIVVNAVVGAAGLKASVAALESGKRLALANKESLVAGGSVCERALQRGGGEIAPIDSEHAAIAQCLLGRDRNTVERIILTASGGPFRTRSDLSDVTPDDALAHPTWSMGRKITVDSATLMNKGLEVIEAHRLFGFDYDRIGVVVHPQSVVHGMIELKDGSQILQAGPADMRIPIAMALGIGGGPAFARIDLKDVAELTFEPVDEERFPSLGLAYEAGRLGRTYPAALNAANEVAVHAFLDGRIAFTDIVSCVRAVVDAHEPQPADELEGVLEADRLARAKAERVIAGDHAKAVRG
jgi:1-deoxy-D-xylulose-5-phosphate reductoisomerase